MTASRVDVGGKTITKTQTSRGAIRMEDLPESMQKQILDLIEPGKENVVIEEKTVTERTFIGDREVGAPVPEFSLEKELPLLAKTRKLYEDGGIDYRVYAELVLEKMENYLMTLDPPDRVIFATNQVNDSVFADYVDDNIIKKIRSIAVSS
jgi:hypothetical protein